LSVVQKARKAGGGNTLGVRSVISDCRGMGAGSNPSTQNSCDQARSNQPSSSAGTASSSYPQPKKLRLLALMGVLLLPAARLG